MLLLRKVNIIKMGIILILQIKLMVIIRLYQLFEMNIAIPNLILLIWLNQLVNHSFYIFFIRIGSKIPRHPSITLCAHLIKQNQCWHLLNPRPCYQLGFLLVSMNTVRSLLPYSSCKNDENENYEFKRSSFEIMFHAIVY